MQQPSTMPTKGGLTMAKYRIVSKYPCYNGCIPFTGYFVQVLRGGIFNCRWVDIKGFDTYERAEELKKQLEG